MSLCSQSKTTHVHVKSLCVNIYYDLQMHHIINSYIGTTLKGHDIHLISPQWTSPACGPGRTIALKTTIKK